MQSFLCKFKLLHPVQNASDDPHHHSTSSNHFTHIMVTCLNYMQRLSINPTGVAHGSNIHTRTQIYVLLRGRQERPSATMIIFIRTQRDSSYLDSFLPSSNFLTCIPFALAPCCREAQEEARVAQRKLFETQLQLKEIQEGRRDAQRSLDSLAKCSVSTLSGPLHTRDA